MQNAAQSSCLCFIMCNGTTANNNWLNGDPSSGIVNLNPWPYTAGRLDLAGALWKITLMGEDSSGSYYSISVDIDGDANPNRYLSVELKNKTVFLSSVGSEEAPSDFQLWYIGAAKAAFGGAINQYAIQTKDDGTGKLLLNGITGSSPGGVDLVFANPNLPSGCNWYIVLPNGSLPTS